MSGGGEGSAVFISNLQWWTTDAELEQLCAAYGHVLTIRFIDDKACGKSRGMAIVEFAESDAAGQCIAGLNGCESIWGRKPGLGRRDKLCCARCCSCCCSCCTFFSSTARRCCCMLCL